MNIHILQTACVVIVSDFNVMRMSIKLKKCEENLIIKVAILSIGFKEITVLFIQLNPCLIWCADDNDINLLHNCEFWCSHELFALCRVNKWPLSGLTGWPLVCTQNGRLWYTFGVYIRPISLQHIPRSVAGRGVFRRQINSLLLFTLQCRIKYFWLKSVNTIVYQRIMVYSNDAQRNNYLISHRHGQI